MNSDAYLESRFRAQHVNRPCVAETKTAPSVSHNELNDVTHLKGVTLQVCHFEVALWVYF